jgi:vacuolar-type H+-ATPase catalytic subunit A/Vma1
MKNKYIPNKSNKSMSSLFHDPGTILQEIKNINNHSDMVIPENIYSLIYYSKYTNSLIKNKNEHYKLLRRKFNKSKYIVIELSTFKSILYNNMYLDYVQVTRFKKKIPISINQDLFKNNTIKLIEYLKSIKKKMSIVGVIYSNKWKNIKLATRQTLNNILEEICQKYNVPFFNPSILLNNNNITDLLKDSSHYTDNGKKLFAQELMKLLN